jgi:hypothetical protein
MQNHLCLFFKAAACSLVLGLSSCGVFKNGDCDCPAFSQRLEEPAKASEACGEETFAVDSPEADSANSL